jgi:hypothetical protein
MNEIKTVPKDVIQRRLNNALKESLDLMTRLDYHHVKLHSYQIGFLRQILEQKFDMDLTRIEDEYSRECYPAQD